MGNDSGNDGSTDGDNDDWQVRMASVAIVVKYTDSGIDVEFR